MLTKLDDSIRHMGDGVAATVAVMGGFFLTNMNLFVLALTGIWTLIRIWETETVRKMTGRLEKDDG